MKGFFYRCITHVLEWFCFVLAMLSMCFLLYLADSREKERYQASDREVLEHIVSTFGDTGTVIDTRYCFKHRQWSVLLSNEYGSTLLVNGKRRSPEIGEKRHIVIDCSGKNPVLSLGAPG